MTTKPPQPSPDYLLTAKVFKAFRAAWFEQSKQAGVDEVHYARLSLVALAQLTAIVAVDINMPPEAFLNVCRATFDEAYRNTPKFG